MNKKLSFTVSNHTTHGVKPHRVIFHAIVMLPEEINLEVSLMNKITLGMKGSDSLRKY